MRPRLPDDVLRHRHHLIDNTIHFLLCNGYDVGAMKSNELLRYIFIKCSIKSRIKLHWCPVLRCRQSRITGT